MSEGSYALRCGPGAVRPGSGSGGREYGRPHGRRENVIMELSLGLTTRMLRFSILLLAGTAFAQQYTISTVAGGAPPATPAAALSISAHLRERGVLMNAINQRCLRAVTHYDVDRAQCV